MIQRASPWTAGDVARAVGGELRGPAAVAIAGVSTDTRDPLAGQLFVALVGERFDAHDFLAQAIGAGAPALLVGRAGLARVAATGFSPGDVPLIVVEDTLFALGALGAEHRKRFGLPVLALTGSNGKTTTKEMLAAILAESRPVLKTEGNLNNLVGVPMTLLGLTPAHRVAVVEMGMNARGEIARYAEIARPDLGLVTNVGPAHIGRLGSLRAIAEAKGELYFGLDRTAGIAVVNADDPEVTRMAALSKVEHIRSFGQSSGAAVRVLEVEPIFAGGADPTAGQRLRLAVDGRVIEVELPIAGAHNALNAAAAVAAATAPLAPGFPASLAEVTAGLPKAVRVGRRMSFESIGPYVVVDDCYNANSASMLAAIDTVAARVERAGGRFVALLGEMRELGDHAHAEHARVGRALAARGAAVVAAFGPAAGAIIEGLREGATPDPEAARHEPGDFEALYGWLRARLAPGDVILVKGSRGMAMERFIERLRKEPA